MAEVTLLPIIIFKFYIDSVSLSYWDIQPAIQETHVDFGVMIYL